MDLAMVKQEQGETIRKYMRRFFDKCATVVDVTDKEVIDLFQDGLYHRRTYEDFGRHRASSITHLKDMITSWADEEDKANAKYDSIRGRANRTRAAAAATTGTKAAAATTTRVPIASASQTTLSRLSNTPRRRTRRRPPAASKTY
jgi:hypothetical protein